MRGLVAYLLTVGWVCVLYATQPGRIIAITSALVVAAIVPAIIGRSQ